MDEIPQQLTGLDEIAVVALVAVLLGFVFMRLAQPPIVGYILAGVILGPTGLGLVHQTQAIELLAELGVLLLLFLIGMEISIRAFVMVIKPAVIIATGQIATALAVTTLFGSLIGWTLQQILLLGFIVAVSSTAVTLKILEEIDQLRSETGRITVGVMIAQDIAIVPMLIMAEGFGHGGGFSLAIVFKSAFAIALLAALIWFLGKPGKLRLPFSDTIEEKPDVVALAAVAFCFSAGAVSVILGLSPAYGAFIAGLIIAKSTLRHDAIETTYPIQAILVFVFFLSIGLLIDLEFIAGNLFLVVSFAIGVVLLKTVVNIALTNLAGQSWSIAFPASLAMAQVGEFSFILAAVGLRNGVLDADTYRLALSVIALSILISPVWMSAARRFHEAATEGISDYRSAIDEVYGEDLARLHEHTSGARHKVRIYGRAARMAWFRAKRRRNG